MNLSNVERMLRQKIENTRCSFDGVKILAECNISYKDFKNECEFVINRLDTKSIDVLSKDYPALFIVVVTFIGAEKFDGLKFWPGLNVKKDSDLIGLHYLSIVKKFGLYYSKDSTKQHVETAIINSGLSTHDAYDLIAEIRRMPSKYKSGYLVKNEIKKRSTGFGSYLNKFVEVKSKYSTDLFDELLLVLKGEKTPEESFLTYPLVKAFYVEPDDEPKNSEQLKVYKFDEYDMPTISLPKSFRLYIDDEEIKFVIRNSIKLKPGTLHEVADKNNVRKILHKNNVWLFETKKGKMLLCSDNVTKMNPDKVHVVAPVGSTFYSSDEKLDTVRDDLSDSWLGYSIYTFTDVNVKKIIVRNADIDIGEINFKQKSKKLKLIGETPNDFFIFHPRYSVASFYEPPKVKLDPAMTYKIYAENKSIVITARSMFDFSELILEKVFFGNICIIDVHNSRTLFEKCIGIIERDRLNDALYNKPTLTDCTINITGGKFKELAKLSRDGYKVLKAEPMIARFDYHTGIGSMTSEFLPISIIDMNTATSLSDCNLSLFVFNGIKELSPQVKLYINENHTQSCSLQKIPNKQLPAGFTECRVKLNEFRDEIQNNIGSMIFVKAELGKNELGLAGNRRLVRRDVEEVESSRKVLSRFKEYAPTEVKTGKNFAKNKFKKNSRGRLPANYSIEIQSNEISIKPKNLASYSEYRIRIWRLENDQFSSVAALNMDFINGVYKAELPLYANKIDAISVELPSAMSTRLHKRYMTEVSHYSEVEVKKISCVEEARRVAFELVAQQFNVLKIKSLILYLMNASKDDEVNLLKSLKDSFSSSGTEGLEERFVILLLRYFLRWQGSLKDGTLFATSFAKSVVCYDDAEMWYEESSWESKTKWLQAGDPPSYLIRFANKLYKKTGHAPSACKNENESSSFSYKLDEFGIPYIDEVLNAKHCPCFKDAVTIAYVAISSDLSLWEALYELITIYKKDSKLATCAVLLAIRLYYQR